MYIRIFGIIAGILGVFLVIMLWIDRKKKQLRAALAPAPNAIPPAPPAVEEKIQSVLEPVPEPAPVEFVQERLQAALADLEAQVAKPVEVAIVEEPEEELPFGPT